MNKHLKHLLAAVTPLGEGVDPPAEKLPEPERIPISKEEYEALFQPWPSAAYRLHENVDDYKDLGKLLREQEDKIIRDMMISSASEVKDE